MRAIKGCPVKGCPAHEKHKHFSQKDDMFCSKCGAKLVYVCAKCNKTLDDDKNRYCERCRAEIDDGLGKLGRGAAAAVAVVGSAGVAVAGVGKNVVDAVKNVVKH